MDHPPPQVRSTLRAEQLGRPEPVRAWTPVGTVDAAALADVDPAGLVAPRGVGWSLDWAVGAEDRWHVPAAEAAVRQEMDGDVPVLVTSMRVPGGDVVHRCGGVRGRCASGWDDSAVSIEITNDTAVPVALALVLRPVRPDGGGRTGRLELQGRTLRLDGTVVAVLSHEPLRVARGGSGDAVVALADGADAPVEGPVEVRDGDAAELALVVPLAHTATVRVLLPRAPERPGPVARLVGRRPAEPDEAPDVPQLESVVGGWAAHTAGSARVDTGDALLDRVVAAAPAVLTLSFGDDAFAELPHDVAGAERIAQVAEALWRCGVTDPLAPLARGLMSAQRYSGAVELADGSDATAALVCAAASVLAAGPVADDDPLLGGVGAAVHHAARAEGIPCAALLGRSLSVLAPVLAGTGQPDLARAAARVAAALPVAAGDAGTPAGRAADGSDELVAVAVAVGADPTPELLRGLCRPGMPGSVGDRYDDDGVPCGVMGHDPAAVAARANAVLDALVADGGEGPVLLRGWGPAWWGRPLEAHAVRGPWGVTSFALRWHGERPALLWEVDPGPHAGEVEPVVRAPGLDPAWRGRGWSGEALLAPLAPPAGVEVDAVAGPQGADPATGAGGDLPGEGESFS